MKVYVIEDNPVYNDYVCNLLKKEGFDTMQAYHLSTARKLLAKAEDDDIVLADLRLLDGESIDLLRWMRANGKRQPFIVMTDYAEVHTAVESMKLGSSDYIPKRLVEDKLVPLVRSLHKMQEKKKHSQVPIFTRQGKAYQEIKRRVRLVAPTRLSVLILGENGTGKEVLANEIHRLSARSCKKMLPVDMGAISETLFESELFGHVKGAFTDAKVDKPGKFELADGSTIFLDEIGNLSYSLQAKLLTALQRRSIVRVGGSTQIPINVRLVCATNRNLQQMVNDGEFREDLLYRINTIHLELPALRQRKADIVPLANRFLRQYGDMYNKTNLRFSDEAERKLISLPWYGNIRELQHAIEKAVILSDSGMISAEDIDGGNQMRREKPLEEVQTLDEMESRMIEKTIKECEGNLSVVAARLGISRQTLYNKIKRYGI